MADKSMTREQLIGELEMLRQRIAQLEASEVEHVQTEKSLLLGESYQRLFQLFPIGVTVLDMKGVILYCNSTVYSKGGYKEGEFTGKHFSKIAPVRLKDIPTFIRIFNSVVRGKIPKPFEASYPRKDGTTGWTELSINLVKIGRKRCILVAQHDITERKKMEEALRQKTGQQAAVLSSIPAFVYLKDTESKLISANDAFAAMVNTPVDQLPGKDAYDLFPKAQATKFHFDDKKVMESGKAIMNIEEQFTDAEGKTRWASSSKAPYFDEKGKVIGMVGITLDITERKRAEEVLRESEERYRTLAEAMNDGVFTLDLEGKYSYCNRRFEEVTGYTPGDLIGQHFSKVVAPEYLELAIDRFRWGISGEETPLYEVEILSKDGKRTPIESNVKAILDKEGRVTGRLGVARDITERKQMEMALQHSEREKGAILESMSELVVYQDAKHKILWANRAAAESVGLAPKELIGRKCYEIWPRRSEPCEGCPVAKARESGHSREAEITTPDGRIWFIRGYPIRGENNAILDVVEVISEITERKKMEEELELRAQLLDNVQDAVNLTDFNGNIIYVNEMACKSLGYSREELLKMNLGELDTEGYAHALKWRNQELMKKKHTIFETANFRKDGSVIPVEVHSQLVEVGGKKLVLSVDRDITERKRAEAEKREMEQKAQLESRLASIGEMASGVAHEINNPLVGVVGFSQLLMERKDLPDDARAQLKMIYDGGQRVAGIVDRLLTFTRQRKPERAYVDINQIIETTLKMRDYEMETASIKLVTQLAPELPPTMADAGQLQQVFLNLGINAEKEMVLAHGKGNLHVRTETVDNTIRISFKDDGPGIAKENLGKIFDPFFTTREVGQGTGLGLSVCHGIIAEHNGRIYAESKPRRGATFIVELPVISEEKQLEMAEPSVGEPERVTKARILVVDDVPTNLQYLSDVFTGEGYEVETVDNCGDALKMINKREYDLLLLDIKIPGMSGIELYERIQKAVPSLAGRVVFITGDVMGEDTMKFLYSTEAPYVTKPFDSKKLKGTINRLLAG